MSDRLPLWLKIAHTSYLVVLVPIYWRSYGLSNFLWFSDLALFTAAAALWLESSLLFSIVAVATLLPEIAWNVDFFFRLVSGRQLLGLADYMFDARLSLGLRSLSLFHVYLPILVVSGVARLGYDSRALAWQLLAGTFVCALCFAFTKPEENVNWVYGPGSEPQHLVAPHLYFAGVLLAFPLLVYLPDHLLLKRWFAAS
jgi:hypothetical protein